MPINAAGLPLPCPAQEVFDISIARSYGRDGAIPIVTTSEREAITLFACVTNDAWTDLRIQHAPIAVRRGGPSISNTWNWSRHVGLATSQKLIYVVYKRAPVTTQNQIAQPARLMLDVVRLTPDGDFEPVRSFPVPMPTYVRFDDLGSGLEAIPTAHAPGFELWAGIDEERRKLLIVTQAYKQEVDQNGEAPKLFLIEGDLEQLDDTAAWRSLPLGDGTSGGYGLDVRHTNGELILVFRNSAAAVTIPNPTVVDPLLGGTTQVVIVEAGLDSDHYYAPLTVLRTTLDPWNNTAFEIPGGEHPCIQSVEPLMITVDRPHLRVSFSLSGTDLMIDWQVRDLDKVAFVCEGDPPQIARGVLMSFGADARFAFPRTASTWVRVQDLFTPVPSNVIGWASTWARYPLQPLATVRAEKGLVFDFLHKAPRFALLRSRAELALDFSEGVLSVVDLKHAVYDINHGHIRNPDELEPEATGETTQFGPFGTYAQPPFSFIQTPSYRRDDTIGGSLVTDRAGIPFQFVSYTDLGDGGLRVIFDSELPPPHEPKPIEKDRLEPPSVPGPGSGSEQWVVLNAANWVDALVPSIMLDDDLSSPPTVTSFFHSRIESLIHMGLEEGLSGAQLSDTGWTETEVNPIQSTLDAMSPSTQTIDATDGITPQASININRSTISAGATSTWTASLEGTIVETADWTFSTPLTTFTLTGNGIEVVFPSKGNWTVQVALNNGSRNFTTEVTVEESLFRTLSRFVTEISKAGLPPPLNQVGDFHLGTSTLSLLQYEIGFPVNRESSMPHSIIIKTLKRTDAEWCFARNVAEQGVIQYRQRVTFACSDIRLEGLLGSLAAVEKVNASFFYGRPFTPGILMNDTRNVSLITGQPSDDDGLEQPIGPRLSSTITARPFGDAEVQPELIEVKVSMLGSAVVAAVITLLLGLGAIALANALISLSAALASAIASSLVPGAGLAALALVVLLTVAIGLLVFFAVPPVVEARIKEHILKRITSREMIETLEDLSFFQFAGEGIGESIARQALTGAGTAVAGTGASFPGPATGEAVGTDRFIQDRYQMIHVSEGQCRVLVKGF